MTCIYGEGTVSFVILAMWLPWNTQFYGRYSTENDTNTTVFDFILGRITNQSGSCPVRSKHREAMSIWPEGVLHRKPIMPCRDWISYRTHADGGSWMSSSAAWSTKHIVAIEEFLSHYIELTCRQLPLVLIWHVHCDGVYYCNFAAEYSRHYFAVGWPRGGNNCIQFNIGLQESEDVADGVAVLVDAVCNYHRWDRWCVIDLFEELVCVVVHRLSEIVQ